MTSGWRLPGLVFMVVASVVIGATSVAANTTSPANVDPLTAINAVAPHVFAGQATQTTSAPKGATISSDQQPIARLPRQAAAGVSLTYEGQTLTVGIPAASKSVTKTAANGTRYFTAPDGSSVMPVSKTDGSVQLVSVSQNAKSTSEFRYPLGLPEGVSVSATPDGGYVLQNAASDLVGLIGAPWALDATGAAVPTRYEMDGDTLVQHVALTTAGIVFPVVADPTVYFFWWGYVSVLKVGETVSHLVATVCIRGCRPLLWCCRA